MNEPEEQVSGDHPTRPWSKQIGPFLTLGLQLALSVVVFFFLGRWLDSMLDTAPWLMILGLGLGIAGGFLQFIRTALAVGKEEDKEAKEERKRRGGEGR